MQFTMKILGALHLNIYSGEHFLPHIYHIIKSGEMHDNTHAQTAYF